MVILLFVVGIPALCAEPVRVAILPFKMNAEKDLSFMKEGIRDMLASRLAWKDNVVIVGKKETLSALEGVEGFSGESLALLVGGKLQADYVLSGSLTVFGESVSMDANMLDVTGKQAPLAFYNQSKGMGEVIPKVNQFATQINETMFGRTTGKKSVSVMAADTGGQPQPAKRAEPEIDIHAHPEKLLAGGVVVESSTTQVAEQSKNTPNPAFIATAPSAEEQTPSFWKSQNFKSLITGIDIGDVDNDGQLETVVATNDTILVYRYQNGRFFKVTEVARHKTLHYVGIDVADINENGTPEIFVSSLNATRSGASSFVVEFDGNGYATLVDGAGWFYRVSKNPLQDPILLGQYQKMGADIFNAPIYEMVWKSGGYEKNNRIIKGKRANVIGALFDDITNDGQHHVLAYTTGDNLRIFEKGGGDMWKGGDRFGGSLTRIELTRTDPGVDNIQYFPMRIRTADINKDGKLEVIAVKNHELAKNTMKDFRMYKKSHIESLSWNGLGLASNWKTTEISGRISDYVIGDFDNDGADELVACVVMKEGSLAFTNSQSSVIAYDLKTE